MAENLTFSINIGGNVYKGILQLDTALANLNITANSTDNIFSSTTFQLFSTIKSFDKYTLLFDSNQRNDSYDCFWKRISGQKDIVIIIELSNDYLLGMYFDSIPFHTFEVEMEITEIKEHFLFTIDISQKLINRYDRFDFDHTIASQSQYSHRNVFFTLNNIFKLTTSNTIILNKSNHLYLKYTNLRRYYQLFGYIQSVSEELRFERIVAIKFSNWIGNSITSLLPYETVSFTSFGNENNQIEQSKDQLQQRKKQELSTDLFETIYLLVCRIYIC